jgi:hypothetical protein
MGKSRRAEIAATYDYRGADGRLRFQVVRRADKSFAQRRPDGAGGWVWNLDGVDRVLYRLPELLDAGPDERVFVAEGEKDVDRLRALGFTATCNPEGAGKWRPEYAGWFRHRPVVVLPDNDQAGRDHARDITRGLDRVAASVRVVELTGLPLKGDVSDWLDAGGSADVLDRIAAGLADAIPGARAVEPAEAWSAGCPEMLAVTTPSLGVTERILPFRTARLIRDATPAKPDWVAEGWAAVGAITEVDGKVKLAGKTTWTTHLCRAALDGRPFMGKPTTKTPVVYLTEQSPATFREALRRAGLLDREDFAVLCRHDTIGVPWPEVVAAARAKCRELGARLLVVDTLPQFAGVRGDAENNAGAALEAVAPLQVAAGDGLAVIVLRHERKSGGEVGDSGRGSSAYSGACDIVL